MGGMNPIRKCGESKMTCHNQLHRGRPPKKATSELALKKASNDLRRSIKIRSIFTDIIARYDNTEWCFGLVLMHDMNVKDAATRVVNAQRNLAIASE